MTEKEYAKTIAKNLKRIAYESGKSQIEIAHDLGINQATLSSWMTGIRTPKMSKVDMLCNYFNCKRTDIIGSTAEYQKSDIKPLEKLGAKDIELLNAYHSSPKNIQDGIRKILGLELEG